MCVLLSPAVYVYGNGRYTYMYMNVLPYSLKFSRIKYFAVWLNSAQKQIFADKIFVVERESRKVHTYVYNKY